MIANKKQIGSIKMRFELCRVAFCATKFMNGRNRLNRRLEYEGKKINEKIGKNTLERLKGDNY
jgi:hypothetical protein